MAKEKERDRNYIPADFTNENLSYLARGKTPAARAAHYQKHNGLGRAHKLSPEQHMYLKVQEEKTHRAAFSDMGRQMARNLMDYHGATPDPDLQGAGAHKRKPGTAPEIPDHLRGEGRSAPSSAEHFSSAAASIAQERAKEPETAMPTPAPKVASEPLKGTPATRRAEATRKAASMARTTGDKYLGKKEFIATRTDTRDTSIHGLGPENTRARAVDVHKEGQRTPEEGVAAFKARKHVPLLEPQKKYNARMAAEEQAQAPKTESTSMAKTTAPAGKTIDPVAESKARKQAAQSKKIAAQQHQRAQGRTTGGTYVPKGEDKGYIMTRQDKKHLGYDNPDAAMRSTPNKRGEQREVRSGNGTSPEQNDRIMSAYTNGKAAGKSAEDIGKDMDAAHRSRPSTPDAPPSYSPKSGEHAGKTFMQKASGSRTQVGVGLKDKPKAESTPAAPKAAISSPLRGRSRTTSSYTPQPGLTHQPENMTTTRQGAYAPVSDHLQSQQFGGRHHAPSAQGARKNAYGSMDAPSRGRHSSNNILGQNPNGYAGKHRGAYNEAAEAHQVALKGAVSYGKHSGEYRVMTSHVAPPKYRGNFEPHPSNQRGNFEPHPANQAPKPRGNFEPGPKKNPVSKVKLPNLNAPPQGR